MNYGFLEARAAINAREAFKASWARKALKALIKPLRVFRSVN